MKRTTNTARGNANIAAHRAFIFTGLIAAATALTLASCTADPIFAAIEEEVALADPSVRGIVSSMVFTDDADGTKYAANGRVYRKTGANGSWNELSLPEHRCAQLAWDGTNVYGLMQDSDYQEAGVYSLSGNTWTKITGTGGMVRIFSGNGFVFGFTHSGDEDGGTYAMYHVTTAGAGAAIGTDFAKPTGSAIMPDGSDSWFSTLGGVYNDDGTELNGTSSMPTGILAMTASDVTAGALYAASKSTLYQYDVGTTTWSSISHEGTQTGLSSIAWLRTGTSAGVILVAGADTDGYSEVTVTGAVGATPVLTDSHSVGSGVSSLAASDLAQYESTLGQWTVNWIFADSNPAGIGSNNYVLYAGVVNDRGYDGLWAYYPVTRSEWNRE